MCFITKFWWRVIWTALFFLTQLTIEWLVYKRYILPQFSSALLLVVKHFLKSSQFFVMFSQHREQCLKGKHMYGIWREYKAEAGEKIKPCACEWKNFNIFLLKFFFRCHQKTFYMYTRKIKQINFNNLKCAISLFQGSGQKTCWTLIIKCNTYLVFECYKKMSLLLKSNHYCH